MSVLNLTAETTLLFVGDSITDAGRRDDPERLGIGYVRLIRDWLRARDPATAPRVINVGISGNKVPDLKARWDRDVIGNSPDIVSVMIGINDVWHGLNPAWAPGVEIETYITTYREILMELRGRRPGCRLVLCEPSVISPPAHENGNEPLRPYVAAVNQLAADFVADAVVPLHETFRQAERVGPDIHWTTDGVHPTSTGHALIARTWLNTVGLL
jgi:acyl-CoA thioesterase-1